MAGTNTFRAFRKRSESPFYADTIEVIPLPRGAAVLPAKKLPEPESDDESELSERSSEDNSSGFEYKEDSSATTASSPPQTRGRGRPRKNPVPLDEPLQPVKRRPGRPRKNPEPEPEVQDDDQMDVDSESSIEIPVKRGRGRPRKGPLPETPLAPETSTGTPKRKPGRPGKHTLPATTSSPSSPAQQAGIRRSDRLLRLGIYDQEPTPAKEPAPAPQATEIRALEDISIYEARKCIGVERPKFETAEDFIAANDFYADDEWREVVKKGWFGYYSVAEIARNLQREGFFGDVDEIFFFLRFSGLWWVDRMAKDKVVPA